MIKRLLKLLVIAFVLLQTNAFTSYAQGVPQGFNYQAVARNATNQLVTNQTIHIKIGILAGSASGTLEWEETHSVTTNQFGLFTLVIGQGTSTGNGSVTSFSSINWRTAAHYLKVSMDINGGSNYLLMDNSQLLSVPYAFYSEGTDTVPNISLNQLTDADTAGVSVGKTLKWNGLNWVPAKDNNSDTAMYSVNSGHSITSDTAHYTLHATPSDSAIYSIHSGTALFADSSASAINATHSIYSDTAQYAINCGSGTSSNDWHITGNTGTVAGTNFLGSTDSVDLVFKTNNQERMRVTASGKVGIGTSTPTASFHIIGNDGFVSQGTFGSGSTAPPVSGAGTRMMWYPRRSAFRVGTVAANQWDSIQVGNYSFASGLSSVAKSFCTVAMGQTCFALDSGAVALGYNAQATGYSSVAIGNATIASGNSSVCLGRNPTASGTAAVAIGYHTFSSAPFSTTIGDHCIASGSYSTALGYYCSTNSHLGSFVFADASSMTATNNTADNQFMVRCTGGSIFYTGIGTSQGVTLPANGGGWSNLSNKKMKENFQSVDGNEILRKIAEMPLTSWNYKSQSKKIRHVGPMAQDFYAAFGFGESDTTITTVDIDGINMVAIKALIEKTNELKKKTKEIEELKATVASLKKNNDLLESRIETMESTINKKFKLYSQASSNPKIGDKR